MYCRDELLNIGICVTGQNARIDKHVISSIRSFGFARVHLTHRGCRCGLKRAINYSDKTKIELVNVASPY